MQKAENNALGTVVKPPAPGWTCKLDSKAKGYVCRKGGNAIEDQLIWTLKGRRVGPAPKAP